MQITEITIKHKKPIAIPLDEEARKKVRAIKEHVLTPARIIMDDVRIEVGDRGGYSLKTVQVPLDHYYKSRVIQREEYRAGDRLFRDFYLSGQTSNLTVNLNPIRAGEFKSYWPTTDRQKDALDNWRKAIGSVRGKIGQLMINNVCCHGYWVTDMKYMPYTERSAIHRFREALADLVDFYKTS